MFTSLAHTGLSLLTLSAQQHNTLNALMIDEIIEMMEREKWTCHSCGVHLPQMMEVDHLKGHGLSGKSGIMPICQFCHDRKHLIWAASRDRISVVHAPDYSQAEITQLCWMLLLHSEDEDISFDMKKLRREMNSRREDAVDALGSGNMESVIEGIQALMDSRGKENVVPTLEEIDEQIKIVPSLIFEESPKLKTWANGGFVEIDPSWRAHAKPDNLPAADVIRRAGESLMSQL